MWEGLKKPLSAPRQDWLSPLYFLAMFVWYVHKNLQKESFFSLLELPIPKLN